MQGSENNCGYCCFRYSISTGRPIYDPNLVREILRTLAAIGTQADVAAIKRLMRTTNISQDLREAARVCLTRIEERLALQQTNETLLRPNGSPCSC